MHLGSEIECLLAQGRELCTEDFMSVCGDKPAATVYSKIRALCLTGRVSRVGRGRYIPVHKPKYLPDITPWMREVNDLLIDECVGIDHCLCERDANLYIETYKGDIPRIVECLDSHGYKVVDKHSAEQFPARIEGYIIVGPRVTEAPLIEEEDIVLPSLEKDLVDLLCRKNVSEDYLKRHYQKMMEVYPVNRNKLNRYAARRGVCEELHHRLSSLDMHRIEMFSKIQGFLSSTPVVKAWVFGSFARGEENDSSDLDLLVDYDRQAHVSLLDIIRYKLDMERSIGREVDLVTNGSLKPFAIPSAERDKYLIYAR